MKDLPHHIKQYNRKVFRSLRHEMAEEKDFDQKMPPLPAPHRSERTLKKQAKIQRRKERESRIPIHPTEEQRNRAMKHRTPIFEREDHYSKLVHTRAKPALPKQRKTVKKGSI